MKGVVFNLLESMVEEKFGLEAWDELLQRSGSDGVFVSTGCYSDEELTGIVVAASEMLEVPVNDLVRKFGEYMFPRFEEKNSHFFTDDMDLKSFLLTVDRVIHVEVRKLHPDANLPSFEYIDSADDELTMIYSSPRKMCMLAEGLISGAAKHFDTSYTLEHNKCMHNGEDFCELHLKIAA